MTREEAKELLPIMQAFADGKKIETRYDIYDWTETEVLHLESNNEYRIKPEPKYRPFKSQEECWNEMHKHPDFGWVTDGYYKSTICVKSNSIAITISSYEYSFVKAFETHKFTDGTPFGIKEEE